MSLVNAFEEDFPTAEAMQPDETLRARTQRILRDAILDGHYAAGQKLVERELCDLTGASRSILREALVNLEVNGLIENWSKNLPRDEAYAKMRSAKVPVAPVRTIEEVRLDPHLHQRGMLEWIEHPDMGEIVLSGNPLRYTDYDQPQLAYYPEPGQHNEEVLGAWLAMDSEEIAALESAGVV